MTPPGTCNSSVIISEDNETHSKKTVTSENTLLVLVVRLHVSEQSDLILEWSSIHQYYLGKELISNESLSSKLSQMCSMLLRGTRSKM